MQYTITYTGKGISLNAVRGGNWRTTHTAVASLKTAFCCLIIEAKIPKLHKYRISLLFNCKYDVDNTVYMAKVMVDSLRAQGKAVEDTKKYYRGLTIEPDESLPLNTYKFLITAL